MRLRQHPFFQRWCAGVYEPCVVWRTEQSRVARYRPVTNHPSQPLYPFSHPRTSMKTTVLLATLLATLGLCACNPATPPAPVVITTPGPAGAPGATGATGN